MAARIDALPNDGDDVPLLRFVPPADDENRHVTHQQMQDATNALRDAILRSADTVPAGRVSVLFDLRACRLGGHHLLFALNALREHEPMMRQHLQRSVALMPSDAGLTKTLSDAFFALYTPVRPFRVELTEDAALAFLRPR